MCACPKLLVVDDEIVICQACRRVFTRQGFEVEECTDARDGLARACQNDYAAILLDIKMPELDGIEFLESLRQKKPEIPVMIMTGYPSIPNAAAVVRLGASDYVTKPFTPEEITLSVQRMLAHRDPDFPLPAESALSKSLRGTAEEAFLFMDESWVQLETDGSARTGAVLVQPPYTTVEEVRLPEVGDVVYQGLPMAAVTVAARSPVMIPAPVSGVVVAANGLLSCEPSALLSEPCGKGWIACVCTTRVEEELDRCRSREVLLVNADPRSALEQSQKLQALGCEVHVVTEEEALVPATLESGCRLAVVDADTLAERGPQWVARINHAAPSLKVVVTASSAAAGWETAYRQQRIFYYSVEPFADGEMVAVLDAVFRPRPPASPPHAEPHVPAEPLGRIQITNRNGHKIRLLASPGLLSRHEGLGRDLLQHLANRSFPIVTTPGDAKIDPENVLKAAGGCHRVMVLLAGETGRLPGSLVRDTKAEYVTAAGESAGRVTTLVVQPEANRGRMACFDRRTTAALVEHIVQEMASY
ncbi:MAG: response regulator [Pirellulales bacterium]|nr:response regulator [Pirellulales bacterium]